MRLWISEQIIKSLIMNPISINLTKAISRQENLEIEKNTEMLNLENKK